MKKINLFLTLLTILSIELHGQSIYVGDKKYSATPTWTFNINGDAYSGDLDVAIAKTDIGGYLWLSTEFPQGTESYISGNLTLYLNDGSTIKCIYRNTRDNVDNKAITLYKLSKQEIDTLKSKRIMTIRFQITGLWSGTKTADNKKYFFEKTSFENSIATEKDIANLFN